jgi:DNA-binding MarR family transcriptional regulator
MADDETVGFLLKEKPCRALFAIQNLDAEQAYGSNISKYIDTTYAHVINVLDSLEGLDLIKSKKKGRKRMYRLTEKGSEYVEDLKQVAGDAWDGSATVRIEMKEESGSKLEGDYDGDV